MKKIDKKDIKQEVFDLYDAYAHNRIDRREFMNQLSVYAVGGLTVASLSSFLLPDYTKPVIHQDDPEVQTEYIEYNSPKGAGKMKGLLARPAKFTGKLPGVIVVHENRGLNPYIEDVARRAAKEGFMTLAPDALTPLGGYPGTDDEGRTMQRTRDREEMLQDFIAGYQNLIDNKNCSGNVGVVGFCFGGWISNMMAVRIPTLKAAVPFYGSQPKAEEVPDINASLLLNFAALDSRVNAGWPAYEEALKANSKDYVAYIYPEVNHGFHNNTTPRYDEEAATLAWERTIDFFKEKLK